MVGAFPVARYGEKTVRLEQGDMLVAYTDGIVEPENAYGEMFGEERLKDLVVKYAKADSSEIIARTMEAVNAVDRRRRTAGRYDDGGGAPPMKVLTAAEMREVDRRTIELGIPGIVLMENAGASRGGVAGASASRRSPRSASWCSAARATTAATGWRSRASCYTRFRPAALDVVLLADARGTEGRRRGELPDAAGVRRRGDRARFPPRRGCATLVVDALLGTGINGPGHGPHAGRHSRDQQRVPAGESGGGGYPVGHAERRGRAGGRIRARRLHRDVHRAENRAAMPPNCDHMGELVVGAIGSPRELVRRRAGSRWWSRRCSRTCWRRARRRAQGNVRPRAGGRGLAGEDGRGGDGRDRGAARRRGPGDGGVATERALPQIAGARAGADDRARNRRR